MAGRARRRDVPPGAVARRHSRKRAEKQLRESEERFRQLAEHIDEVFWLNDSSGAVIYASPAYERIWGRTCESLYVSPRSWIDAIHPEDRRRVRKAVAQTYPERPTIKRIASFGSMGRPVGSVIVLFRSITRTAR